MIILLLLLSETVIADRQQKGVAIRSFIIFIKSSAEDRDKLPTIWRNNITAAPATTHPQRVRTGAAGIPPTHPPTTHSSTTCLSHCCIMILLCNNIDTLWPYDILTYTINIIILYRGKRKSMSGPRYDECLVYIFLFHDFYIVKARCTTWVNQKTNKPNLKFRS